VKGEKMKYGEYEFELMNTETNAKGIFITRNAY
jgi:hypothetical protein